MDKGTIVARSPSLALVEAIADARGVDPLQLDFTLHDYIDNDALDSLIDGPDGDWELEFTVVDHTLRVNSKGLITVDGNQYHWKRN